MRIIIHADDFGMTKSINGAIIELLKCKTLSSTSIMANMPFTQEAEKLLEIDHISLGLHSTFTQGKPVTDPAKVPSLVDSNGHFLSYDNLVQREKANKIVLADILTELESQYAKVKKIIGDKLVFIDSHHSIHNKLKTFREAFIQFGNKHQIKAIRNRRLLYLEMRNDKVRMVDPTIFKFPGYSLKNIATNYYYKYYSSQFEKHFKVPKGQLVVSKKDSIYLFEYVENLLNQNLNSEEVYYVVAHPATETSDLGNTNLLQQRVIEYKKLKSENFIKSVRKAPLINFNHL